MVWAGRTLHGAEMGIASRYRFTRSQSPASSPGRVRRVAFGMLVLVAVSSLGVAFVPSLRLLATYGLCAQ